MTPNQALEPTRPAVMPFACSKASPVFVRASKALGHMNLRKLGFIASSLLIVGFSVAWIAGSVLIAPSRGQVAIPSGFAVDEVLLRTAEGDTVKGWWVAGRLDSPSIILVHGVRANRIAMMDRARLFHKAGYSVFLFDLPAHGESSGDHISYGIKEASAVSEALRWVRSKSGKRRIGVDGLSLGGAGILLRSEHVGFDAIVVEAVFPDIHRAILNRLTDRFGILGYVLEPLLVWQISARLHERPQDLSPISQIHKVDAPILIIGGELDHLTTRKETLEMYSKAVDPKELWIVPGASHDDFLEKDPLAFQRIVLGFFDKYLRNKTVSFQGSYLSSSKTLVRLD